MVIASHHHDPQKFWARNAVVYQIYPRSFKDSNGDGIGDLKGIIDKLDYLNDGTEKSLGVNAIWINPIYRSPQKDFGYDVSDFYSIHSTYGNFEDFKKLISEAHKRGIKIILDFVPNHTSSEHPWFVESSYSNDNDKSDWYIWRDPKPDGSVPNNWLSVFGGSAWSYNERRKQYYLHSFLSSQPDLNWRNDKVRDEMVHIMQFWLGLGVDGFRTDAYYHLIKDKEFRDDPPNPKYIEGKDDPYNQFLHTYSTGQPELQEMTNTLCKLLSTYKDAFMVSESYLGIPEMNKLYSACEENVYAPLNFNLMSIDWSASSYKTFVDIFSRSLKHDQIANYVLGNHDRPRIASRIGHQKARLAAMLLLTLRGMSFIYYGEELGMENAVIPIEWATDPWGKNVKNVNVGRDPERTPMQWDGSQFSGFSTVKPWLPFWSNPKEVNVQSESEKPDSFLNLYKTLIHFKTKSEALHDGIYISIDSENEDIFMFAREHHNQSVLMALNFSDKEQKFAYPIGDVKIACSTYMDIKKDSPFDMKNVHLRPYEGVILTY